MELCELQNAIKTKAIPNLLIFTGNEYEISNLYLSKILKVTKREQMNIPNASSILSRNKVISITNTGKLYLVRYDKDILTNEKLWERMENLGDLMLVLQFQSLDKRSKFYKRFEDKIVDFREQDDNTLSLMLNPVCKLKDSNKKHLMAGCSNNYGRCLRELEKVTEYANAHNISADNAYEELTRQKVIHRDVEIQLQEFMQLVLTRDIKVFSYLQTVKDTNSTMVVLAWLYNAFKNQLIVETMNRPTTENTGLNYFFIKECLTRKNYYSTDELLSALNLVRETEQGIKLGDIEDANALEYLLVQVL